MKIAVIENNKTLRSNLTETLNSHQWKVQFFQNPADFEKTHLHEYDVVISDYNLNPTNGREFLKRISTKSNAELLLMNDEFKKEDIENDYIKGLIDKNNLFSIIDKLKYIKTKLNIQKLANEEKQKLEDIKEYKFSKSFAS